MKWLNYLVLGKYARLTENHIPAEDLYKNILNHNGDPAFSCYFDLDSEKLKLEYYCGETDSDGKKIYYYLPQGQKPDFKGKDFFKPEISFAKYEGIARPALNMVSFDFDNKEEPEKAIEDVRRFCEWLAVDDIAVFYSGSKGFHVMVPFGYFPLEANEHLPNQIKDLAIHLKESFKSLDTSIYDYSRKFRIPFSKHEKTERYKTFVPLTYLNNLSLEAITDNSNHRAVVDFLEDIKPMDKRDPLQIFITAFEDVKRKSYEIEKDRAGTIDKPSKFEAFDGKLCIKKLLESRCDDVGRNNAAIVIVNDFYRTGKTRKACEEIIYKWADNNKLPHHEVSAIVNNIYERGANYNFGCQNEIKSIYCSAKCPIWKKLDPDKRPVTVDMPVSESSNVKEFNAVKDILMQTFKCGFDEFRGEFYGGIILKQGKDDLFYYDEGKWNYLEAAGIDKIKRRFNVMSNSKLTVKKIEAFYKMFLIYVPSVPAGVDMFIPAPHCANFNNGTLHLQEDMSGKFYLEFKDHNPKDYLTFKINYDYIENDNRTNKLFDDMLQRVFDEDEDKEAKINAVAEMFGAALIPYFPHLFYLYGKAESGKSQIIILLRMLIGGENICSVQPKDFGGFNLESMVGKLVNMVTDVNTKKAIEDDIVKQIEDRIPVTIRRKNRTDIQAPMPSVHVFGGNDLMTSYEGYSNAMKRRWTILKFNKIYTGPKMRNFANRVFNSDPQGLVNFAILGLKKIVESQGYFTQFESSNSELSAWAEESDVVGQFISEAENGELNKRFVKQENLKIVRGDLYAAFDLWQNESGYRNRPMSKIEFFKRMASKGFEVKAINGARYFVGYGELTAKGAASTATNISSNII